jgi:hypothetical protein
VLFRSNDIPDHLAITRCYLKKFDEIIVNYGFTRIQAAFLFSYLHSGIDYLVFGVDKMEHLLEDVYLANNSYLDAFKDCRTELNNNFQSIDKSIIFPSLWSRK